MTVTELNCPACAAPLRVADLDKESGAATCSYCGHEFDAAAEEEADSEEPEVHEE